jgi:hypothetical protein
MQTAMPAPVDYDALVLPIEQAADMKAARSAVWDALRTVRFRWNDWDAIAVIDAAAWTRGISQRFRKHAVTAMLDASVWNLDGRFLIDDVATVDA